MEINTELAKRVGEYYADPLGFVQNMYPWGYGSLKDFDGPDKWQAEFLKDLGLRIKAGKFNGKEAVDPIRMAVASGHGIGKSAKTAWLCDFIPSTRPYSKGVVTANTGAQLETKTWAEVAKWTKLCRTGHWFRVTTGRGSMKKVKIGCEESWRVDAQTCGKENSEAFAGLHAASSTPWYIFDEASAVPDEIWTVSEGGKTDGEPMHFVFGNPTRNDGKFRLCFGSQTHRWDTRQIDSRQAKLTNKKLIKEWIDDYGLDSDFVRVRVTGMFPRVGDMQFISEDSVLEAKSRELSVKSFGSWRKYLGVDVARFGYNASVITRRQGPKVTEPKTYRGIDTMELVGYIVEEIRDWQPHAVFVDGCGVGGGVVDRLTQMRRDGHFGCNIIDVNSSNSAWNTRKYKLVRDELWGNMREWLKTANPDLPHHPDLLTQIHSPQYGLNGKMQIMIEKKDDMHKRGIASPDHADSLVYTFAPEKSVGSKIVKARKTAPARRVV